MTNSKQNNIYNVIGSNIKKYRVKRGLTQRELAEALLLSESFIAKLESVTYQSISIDTLEQIANVLNVDISCFFEKGTIINNEKEINEVDKDLQYTS